MRTSRNNAFACALLLAVTISSGNVWASPGTCMDTRAGDTGSGGTGMGGTGISAEGSGMGGTGLKPAQQTSKLGLAGKVIASNGVTEARRDGRSRLLALNDPVCVGETLVTSNSGSVEIKMVDGGLIAVRPQTKLKIEKFVYSRTNRDTSLIALLEGACRFVTGAIGKMYPQNDLITTPTATIGVRGTDHEATVLLPGASGGHVSGTYDKVNYGVTFIRTGKGEVDIHPNQVGFAATAGEAPILLKEVPDFYNANPSLKEEGGSTKEGGRSNEIDIHNNTDKTSVESGGDNSSNKVSEPQSSSGHILDVQHGVEKAAVPGHAELPESVQLPDLPEQPEMPEIMETPEVPDVPD